MTWISQNLTFSNLIKMAGVIAAAVIVGVFVKMLLDINAELFDLIGAKEPKEIPSALWAQMVQLLSTFEKLAMLAAGTLLGVGVQEANVRNAKQDAATEKQRTAEKDKKIKEAKDALEDKASGQPKTVPAIENLREAELRLGEALTL